MTDYIDAFDHKERIEQEITYANWENEEELIDGPIYQDDYKGINYE
tara:strand:+ start:444 stop:581 length:138 start_codon:yes stop_codon:yes gene_type:complete